MSACRLLLVEDDQIIRDTIVLLLGDLDFEVVVAEHAEAALALFDEGAEFDVAIFDNNMPGILGIECVERLREQQNQTPVIISSGFLNDTELASVDSLSNTMYLAKPYDVPSLMETINTFMQQCGQS